MQALTRKQVEMYIKQQDILGRQIAIRVMVCSKRNEFFFTDGHGYYASDRLPDNWVPISVYLPMRVAPRPGLEDGIIATLDDYLLVFHSTLKEVNPKDLFE